MNFNSLSCNKYNDCFNCTYDKECSWNLDSNFCEKSDRHNISAIENINSLIKCYYVDEIYSNKICGYHKYNFDGEKIIIKLEKNSYNKYGEIKLLCLYLIYNQDKNKINISFKLTDDFVNNAILFLQTEENKNDKVFKTLYKVNSSNVFYIDNFDTILLLYTSEKIFDEQPFEIIIEKESQKKMIIIIILIILIILAVGICVVSMILFYLKKKK